MNNNACTDTLHNSANVKHNSTNNAKHNVKHNSVNNAKRNVKHNELSSCKKHKTPRKYGNYCQNRFVYPISSSDDDSDFYNLKGWEEKHKNDLLYAKNCNESSGNESNSDDDSDDDSDGL